MFHKLGVRLFPGVYAYDEWHELWKIVRLFLLLIGVCLVIASFVL